MKSIMVVLALVIVVIPAAYSALPDHIVLYFSFDKGKGNKVFDKSQYYNDGEIIGDVKWVDGKHAGALKLDGSKTVIKVPSSNPLTELTTHMSVGAWLKPVSFPNDACQCLADMESTPGDRTNGWEVGPFGQGSFFFCTYGHADHVADQIKLKVDEWAYLVVVTDGVNIDFYLNGSLAQKVPHQGPIDVTKAPGLNLGAEGGKMGSYYCDVILDEFWISNQTLSKDEVKVFMEPEGLLPVDSRGKIATTWGGVKSR